MMVPLVLEDPGMVSQDSIPVDDLPNEDLASTSTSDIHPLPRLVVQERKKGRNKGRSKVVTSTPEKTLLEQSVESRKRASRKRILEGSDSEDNESTILRSEIAKEVSNDNVKEIAWNRRTAQQTSRGGGESTTFHQDRGSDEDVFCLCGSSATTEAAGSGLERQLMMAKVAVTARWGE